MPVLSLSSKASIFLCSMELLFFCRILIIQMQNSLTNFHPCKVFFWLPEESPAGNLEFPTLLLAQSLCGRFHPSIHAMLDLYWIHTKITEILSLQRSRKKFQNKLQNILRLYHLPNASQSILYQRQFSNYFIDSFFRVHQYAVEVVTCVFLPIYAKSDERNISET